MTKLTTVDDFLGHPMGSLADFKTPEELREADCVDLCYLNPEDYTGWAGYLIGALYRAHYIDWDGEEATQEEWERLHLGVRAGSPAPGTGMAAGAVRTTLCHMQPDSHSDLRV